MSELYNVIEAVSQSYQVPTKDILGRVRTDPARSARMVAMYLVRETTGMSYPTVGKAFDRDHSTVQHACNRVRELMSHDALFAERVADIVRRRPGTLRADVVDRWVEGLSGAARSALSDNDIQALRDLVERAE